jgi:hypothetical protein
MRKHVLVLGAVLISSGIAAAQNRMPDPDDRYGGPREPTFEERWSAATTQPQAAPRLDAEGHDLDAPAPPETTGRSQPRNSPDPAPLPGEEPRLIPR